MDFSWLEQAAQLTIVLSFCGVLFNYVVIRPLNDSIRRLGDAIDNLREDLKQNKEQLNRLRGEVDEIKYALQKAHDRIDEFLKKEASHIGTA
ncbi:MAG: hypothetical protein IJ774_00535 [Selenomonadaceae bacterium]|nr:hypothetical protein [Selenomonadaceae bacterium]